MNTWTTYSMDYSNFTTSTATYTMKARKQYDGTWVWEDDISKKPKPRTNVEAKRLLQEERGW